MFDSISDTELDALKLIKDKQHLNKVSSDIYIVLENKGLIEGISLQKTLSGSISVIVGLNTILTSYGEEVLNQYDN